MMVEPKSSILLPPWNGMSLPGLTRGAALLRSETVLFRDGEGSASLAGRPPREVTGQDLDSHVDLLCRKLIVLGLAPGDRVIVIMPNLVEAMVTLLAVCRAGGVVVTLPVFADLETVTAAALLTDATGLVTMAGFAGLRPAEMARSVAAAAMSMRFVACHGRSAPEGVVALDMLSAEDVADVELPLAPEGTDDALITLDVWHKSPRALCRSHEQLIAEAASAAALSRLTDQSRLITTLAPSSLAGVIYSLALPLLTGATTDLNPLFDTCGFARQLGDGAGMTVILPAAAEEAYRTYCAERPVKAEGLILVHRSEGKARLVLDTADSARDATVDVVALGEIALNAQLRRDWLSRADYPVAPIYPVPGVLAGTASGYVFDWLKGSEMQVAGPLSPQVLCLGDSAAQVVLPEIARTERAAEARVDSAA